jgi:hypothetical protein
MKLGLLVKFLVNPINLVKPYPDSTPINLKKRKKKNEMATFYKMSFSCKSLMLLTGHQGLGQFYKEMDSPQI